MEKHIIKIYGEEYILKSDLPSEELKEIAEKIELDLSKIKNAYPNENLLRIYILLLLNEKAENLKLNNTIIGFDPIIDDIEKYKALYEQAKKSYLDISEENEKISNDNTDLIKEKKDTENKISELNLILDDLRDENIRLKNEIFLLKKDSVNNISNEFIDDDITVLESKKISNESELNEEIVNINEEEIIDDNDYLDKESDTTFNNINDEQPEFDAEEKKSNVIDLMDDDINTDNENENDNNPLHIKSKKETKKTKTKQKKQTEPETDDKINNEEKDLFSNL